MDAAAAAVFLEAAMAEEGVNVQDASATIVRDTTALVMSYRIRTQKKVLADQYADKRRSNFGMDVNKKPM